MQEFTTFSMLATFTGATTATALLTQVMKGYFSIDAKWIAAIVSIVIQLGVQLFYTQDTSPAGIFLSIINAFFVLAASVGTFELTAHKANQKKRS